MADPLLALVTVIQLLQGLAGSEGLGLKGMRM